MLVIRYEFLSQPKPREHRATGAGVLAGDRVDACEDSPRAVREVGKVSDRRRHNIEMARLRGERGILHRGETIRVGICGWPHKNCATTVAGRGRLSRQT